MYYQIFIIESKINDRKYSKVTPGWRMMDQYVPLCIYTAMAVDSLPTTNAMTSSVSSPSEIDSNFNAIAYQKCILINFV